MALDLHEMQQLQRALQERYRDRWEPIDPEHGRNKLLWMIGEVGEVAQIIKRKGHEGIMNDPKVRADFVEELCDVMMFLTDICLCYDITPEEMEAAYRQKQERNMNRW